MKVCSTLLMTVTVLLKLWLFSATFFQIVLLYQKCQNREVLCIWLNINVHQWCFYINNFAVTCPLKFPNPFKIRWVWNNNSHTYIKVLPKSHTVIVELSPTSVFFIPFANYKPSEIPLVLNNLCPALTKLWISTFSVTLILSAIGLIVIITHKPCTFGCADFIENSQL